MKSASGNKFWVPALMLISVVLLTAFVAQWLVSQYKDAEKAMEKDVRADLKKTSDQLLDSLLTKFISVPLSSATESEAFVVNQPGTPPKIQLDSVPKAPKQQAIVNISMTSKSGVVTERMETSHEFRTVLQSHPGDTHSKKMVMITASDTSISDRQGVTELLTKGIGVFIKKMAGSEPGHDILSVTNQPLDSALCKRLLKRNWQSEGLDYRFSLVSNTVKDPNLIFANNSMFPKNIAVSLPNKRSYLLGSLLPQFSFGFFLLLVTTLAFWLTYRSLRKQRQLYELRTDFVNNISHELKTPVSTVKVAVEALQQFNRRQEPEVMDEYLQLMKLEMNRLDKLINQVLTSAMMDESTTFLQTERTDLVPLVQHIIDGFQWQLNHSGAKVEFHPSTDSAIIQGDKTHIEGVLLNLLDNCLKYAGEHPVIRIGLFASAKSVEVTIADEGPGIPQEYLGQLFDKFFRVPTGNEHNVKGYGLGLSYCKQVMEHHKGTISAENLPEKGCLFRLTFPLASQ